MIDYNAMLDVETRKVIQRYRESAMSHDDVMRLRAGIETIYSLAAAFREAESKVIDDMHREMVEDRV